jgi:hypothetical protein
MKNGRGETISIEWQYTRLVGFARSQAMCRDTLHQRAFIIPRIVDRSQALIDELHSAKPTAGQQAGAFIVSAGAAGP